MHRTRTLTGLLFALTLLPAGASAQDKYHQRKSDDVLLESLDREFLHPGENPLELQGLDQGPDGFRSGTPALQRADVSVAMVDAEELRRRRLEMYEGGVRFDTPARSRASVEAAEEARAESPVAPNEPEPEDDHGSGKYAFIGAVAVACGLAAHFFIRRR